MPGDHGLGDWLRRLESLDPARIEFGLERVLAVLGRLAVTPPAGRVFTVAGTNGKGSTVGFLDRCLRAAGYRVGRYTSPHLRRYTERVHVDGAEIAPGPLVTAFADVEAAAAGTPLTYFEFGTLAAFRAFGAAGCDAWVLEVGMGGRLDAVNAVDPDFSLITTIGLDHQEFLGDTIEAIAAEKAGILRAGRPSFYGDSPVPAAIRGRAAMLGSPLASFGEGFGCQVAARGWHWWGRGLRRDDLPPLTGWTAAQYRNAGLALAALEAFDPAAVPAAAALPGLLAEGLPPGRFQRCVRDGREWILDVAHNPQAAGALRAQLGTLPPADTTVVTALLADKAVAGFAAELAPLAARWVVCSLEGSRASPVARLLAGLAEAGIRGPAVADGPAEAFAAAAAATPPGGRIVVCGSFRLVGPALDWLGLYS
jgi:dihydrofolate synthase/folylpolyglutamate synthase